MLILHSSPPPATTPDTTQNLPRHRQGTHTRAAQIVRLPEKTDPSMAVPMGTPPEADRPDLSGFG